jgi:isopentenyldiphosphate isomerase
VELIDVYDESKRKIGKKIRRGEKLRSNERLLITHLCIFNLKGEMLIQKRSFEKDRYPGCWDVSAGGFVLSGENSESAVIREAKEELGICLKPSELKFMLCEPFSYVFDDFFFARADLDPSALNIQSQELSEVKYFPREYIMHMLSDGRFVDYDEDLMKRIFDFEKTCRL